MTSRERIIVGLGELLWDLFPTSKQLGGAPANFAYITNLLGDSGIPASRIGNDSLGNEAIERLRRLSLSSEFVQRDDDHRTGTVRVDLDPAGQPKFEILRPVAWDFLEWSEPWQTLAKKADAVCFGSLAQRSPASRATIVSFVAATRPDAVRVFDVNLRQNFYSKPVLEQSMKLATIVKLNHEELPKIVQMFEMENSDLQTSAHSLLSTFDLKLVCVTRGTGGSLLVSAEECSQHPGFKVKVADTVGAGDAFTAALVHGYVRGESLAEINEHANRVGAWIASQSGGMPAPGPKGLRSVLRAIG
jgi:fructokinase